MLKIILYILYKQYRKCTNFNNLFIKDLQSIYMRTYFSPC